MSNLGKAALNLHPLLHHKNKGMTAKHQDERIAGSTYRIYSCHLDPHIFILFGGCGWWWGLTATPINVSSFYLLNEFFFPSELRRHSETTLHHGVSPLADANV